MKGIVVNLFIFAVLTTFYTYCNHNDSSKVVSCVVIEGNEVTKPEVILREMSLAPGMPITSEAIQQDQNQIYNLGLFNRVDVKESNDTVYVRVVERWFFMPFPIIGFRFNDFSKMYYGFGLSHQNFRGRNEKIGITAGFGYDRWVELQYYAPHFYGNDDVFTAGYVGYQKTHNLSKEVGEYENTNYSIRFSIGKRLDLYNRLYGTVGYDIWSVNDLQAGRTLSNDGKDNYAVLALTYRYDKRDNHEYTTDGSLIHLNVSKYGFDEIVNIYSIEYDLRTFYSLKQGLSLGFRSAGGLMSGGRVPPYLRKYFGYDERIRGHYFKTYEGERRLSFSSEFRIPLFSPRYYTLSLFNLSEFSEMRYGLYGEFFADVGKIWFRHQPQSQVPLLAGYGAGLVVLLPYTVCIRFEVARNEKRATEAYIAWDVSF